MSTPTRKEILSEDLGRMLKWMEFLQQNVPANDTWQNRLLWDHTKVLKDLLEKETT